MLSKKNRLAAEKDFSKLFSKGKSFNGRGIGLKSVRNTGAAPRIGFVVSTKVAKRAVIRNTIKRRMREAAKPFLSQIDPQGVDIAFIARSEAVKMSYVEIRDSMKALFEKSGLVKPETKKS